MLKPTNSEFKSRQIVYLEHGSCRLYSEVIQFVRDRQMYWVRPWLLVINLPLEAEVIYDLRESVDLVWHASQFRLALDTELIPLLTQLDKCDQSIQQTRQQLNCFLNQLWRGTSGTKKQSD